MDMSTTPPARVSQWRILRHYLPSAPIGLILIMVLLALVAIWLGTSSVTEDTSPIDSNTPKLLVETPALAPFISPSQQHS